MLEQCSHVHCSLLGLFSEHCSHRTHIKPGHHRVQFRSRVIIQSIRKSAVFNLYKSKRERERDAYHMVHIAYGSAYASVCVCPTGRVICINLHLRLKNVRIQIVKNGYPFGWLFFFLAPLSAESTDAPMPVCVCECSCTK